MKNIADTLIFRDGTLLMIIANKNEQRVLVDPTELIWNEHEDYGEYLTLEEISEQLINLGYDIVFYIWEEVALRGQIYQ